MKQSVLIAVVSLLCAGLANAQKYPDSPAQNLFDQATFFLETQYFGPSEVNLASLIARYQLEVDQRCATTQMQCAFETVEPLIAAMLNELGDLHAHYLSAAQLRAEQQQSTGTVTTPKPTLGFSHAAFVSYKNQIVMLGGLSPEVADLVNAGEIRFQSFERMIVNVVAGSPAERAGLRYGDRWIGYNGTQFAGFDSLGGYAAFLADLSARIQAGETIRLQLLRGPARTPVDLAVTGEIINAAPFPTMWIDESNIATIRIPHFFVLGVGQRVHELVRQAMQKNVRAIVINLRNTPGGYLHESALAVGAVLGNIETIRFVPRYNAEKSTQEYVWQKDSASIAVRNAASGVELARYSVQNPVLYTGPVAVLANEGCASACEYMVNQLQHTRRAPFLGAPTAGVTNTNTFRFALVNGGAASLPTLRSFWPDGSPLPNRLLPDLATPDAEYTLFRTGRDPGLDGALELLGLKPAGQRRAGAPLSLISPPLTQPVQF